MASSRSCPASNIRDSSDDDDGDCPGRGEGDPAYVGPTYAQSPALRGADNRQFPHTYHNDLRLDPAIVAVYRTWLERFATLPRR